MIPVTAADREAVQLGHFVGDGPIGVDIVESTVGQVEGLFLVKGVDVFQSVQFVPVSCVQEGDEVSRCCFHALVHGVVNAAILFADHRKGNALLGKGLFVLSDQIQSAVRGPAVKNQVFKGGILLIQNGLHRFLYNGFSVEYNGHHRKFQVHMYILTLPHPVSR